MLKIICSFDDWLMATNNQQQLKGGGRECGGGRKEREKSERSRPGASAAQLKLNTVLRKNPSFSACNFLYLLTYHLAQ
jgi:hypothetical protein